ncbi:hypothetical protein L596_029701 [Steinernema carpocapsae]|nr:hypothetical protein L596_029701 [Steinernema carpocapsae]
MAACLEIDKQTNTLSGNRRKRHCRISGAGLLLAGNVILISSVHIIGFNHIPPELNHVCTEVDRLVNIMKSHLKPSNKDPNLICKPIWENNGVGWALQRSFAGTWQTRIPISRQEMIIV